MEVEFHGNWIPLPHGEDEVRLESAAHEFTSCVRAESTNESEEFHMQKEFNHPRLSPGVRPRRQCL